MIQRLSPLMLSLLFSGCSYCLALMSIALGQRFNYLLFPGMFSILAIAVLTLAAAALGIAAMALLRHQGRDYRLWLAAGLAAYLLVVYLSDE